MSLSKCDRWSRLGTERRNAVHEAKHKMKAALQEATVSSVLKLQTPDRTQLLKLYIALVAYNDRIGQDSPVHTLPGDILLKIVNNILPRKYIQEDGVTKAGVILDIEVFWQFELDKYSPRMFEILTRHERILSFIQRNKDKILETEKLREEEEMNSRCDKSYQKKEIDTKIEFEFRNILQQLGVPLQDYDAYNHTRLWCLNVDFVQIERPYITERSHDPYFDIDEGYIRSEVLYVDSIQFYTA
jgi:hypothetical protein